MKIFLLIFGFLIVNITLAASANLNDKENSQTSLEVVSSTPPSFGRRDALLRKFREFRELKHTQEATGIITSAAGAGGDNSVTESLPSASLGYADTLRAPTLSSGSTAPMIVSSESSSSAPPVEIQKIIRLEGDGPWYEHYKIPFLPKEMIHPASDPREDLRTPEAKAVSSMRWFIKDSYSHTLANIYLNPETPINKDKLLKAYLARMEREGKPATLIIGCGHLEKPMPDESMHWHKDCWTINIDWNIFPRLEREGVLKSYANEINTDDVLNITGYLPQDYFDKFDNVVLERSDEKTVNNEITWTNVLLALKINGVLWLEDGIGSDNSSHRGYVYGMGDKDLFTVGGLITYATETFRPPAGTAAEDTALISLTADHQKTVARDQYGLLNYNNGMYDISTRFIENVNRFLVNLYFKDVGNLYAASPFAAGRRSNFIMARKTETTQRLLEEFFSSSRR